MAGGEIVGYKYFGFGGLDEAKDGLKPLPEPRRATVPNSICSSLPKLAGPSL